MIIEKFIRNPEVVDDFMDNCFYGNPKQHMRAQGSPRINWLWDPFTTTNKFPQFSHVLLQRDNPRANSQFYPFFKTILKNFMRDNGLEYKRITRSCLNCTCYFPNYHCGDPHVDYPENHYTALLYLNDVVGSTYIFDKQINYDEGSSTTGPGFAENNGIIPYETIDWENDPIPVKHEAIPEKGKMVLFDGSHYHALCPTSPGDLRLICVYNITY